MSRVVIGVKKTGFGDEWKVTFKINGRYDEGPAAYDSSLEALLETAKSQVEFYMDKGYKVEITKALERAFTKFGYDTGNLDIYEG